MHAPDCLAGFSVSDSAPKVRRAVADAGRYAALRLTSCTLIALALCLLALHPAYAAQPLDVASDALAKVTQFPVRNFSTRDFGRDPYRGARSVLVPDQKAIALLKALRKQLPPGLVAFVGTANSLAEPPVEGTEIVVAPGRDQFDILRVAASDAVNYDMLTEDLIKELQAWDKEFGIDIWQAGTDTIAMDLKALPRDIDAFAKRLYKFCPDIVDQGTGDLASLVREIRRTKQVYLWWD